jgi:hypothetical protein
MRQFRNEDGPLAQLMAQQTQPSIPQAPTGSGILGNLMDNMGIDVEMSSSEAKGTEFKLRASEKPSVTQDDYDPMALWGDASAIVDQEYANMDASMQGNPYDAAVGNLLASASQPIQDPSQMPVDPSGVAVPSGGFSQDVGLGTPMVQPPQNQPVQADTGTLTPDGDSIENTSAGFSTVAKQAGASQNSVEKTIASAGTAGKKVKKNNLMSGNEVTNDKILNKLGWDPERRHTNYLLEMATDMIGRYALMAMAKSQGATYEEALAMANSSHKKILEARAKQETFDEEKRVFDAVQEVFYSTGSYVDPGSQADVYDALMATGMVSPEEAQTISGYHQVDDAATTGYDTFWDARDRKAGIKPFYVPKGEIGPDGTYPTESSAKLGFETMHGQKPGVSGSLDTGTKGAQSDELLYLYRKMAALRADPNSNPEDIKLLNDEIVMKRAMYLDTDKTTASQVNTIWKNSVYGQLQKRSMESGGRRGLFQLPANSKFNPTNKIVDIDYTTLQQYWRQETSPFKVITPSGDEQNFIPFKVMNNTQASVSEMQNDARAPLPDDAAFSKMSGLYQRLVQEFGEAKAQAWLQSQMGGN